MLILIVCAPSVRAVEPSANAGKRGVYQCKTSNPTYNYFVYVPRSYSDTNPAGLHLLFHGQGGHRIARHFDKWTKDFHEPFNLIGINMQYMDGDNLKDTSGKVAAAIEAIQQTMADYKINRGRGVVASFSGGGVPHSMLVRQGAKKGTKRGAWPFNHSAPYGSCYRGGRRYRSSGLVSMSWFLGLGEKEFNMASLGRTQTTLTETLYTQATKGGCPDVYLRIEKGKGHSISAADIAESAKGFRRSDLAFSALFYEQDFPEPGIEKIVKDANRLDIGRAHSAVRKLLAKTKLKPGLKRKAEFIRKKLDDRVEAVIVLAKELAEDDATLMAYYGRCFAKQLKRHPREKELADLVASSKKKQKHVAWAVNLFADSLSKFLTNSGGVEPEAIPVLKKIKKRMGEKSLFGKMATDILNLK